MVRNFLLLIFALSFLHGGEQFVFTARTHSQNHVLTYDKLTISPLMRQRSDVKNKSCQIMIKKSENADTYSFLQEHIYLVAECFMGEKIRVYDYGEQSLQLANYQTDATALPVYFTVDFKEEFVTLTLLGR